MITMIRRIRVGGRPQHHIVPGGVDDSFRRLQELELRFDEYAHRMKNHTQMMLSVLAIAARSAINQEARFALDAVGSKLKAIAHIQAVLTGAARMQTLRCDDLLRELSRAIQAGSPCNFALILDTDPVELPSSAALPLGLILNELLTNSIKHGIDAQRGRVRISLKESAGFVELRVEDNGPGMPESQIAKRNSGLVLVEHLAAQLHGEFQMHSGPGARGVLRFNRVSSG